MKITIFHNPRCSKSRQALELLRERGIEPEVVEYLKTPPDRATLEKWLQQMPGSEPRALMRTKEADYRALGLDNPALDRNALLDAMIVHPHLIERPIVVADGRVAIGRPPEKILEIL